MKPVQYVKLSTIAAALLVCVSATTFASDGFKIDEKLLQTFRQTFPDAQQVRWQEDPDTYTVNFTENSILTKIRYDKDGNFLSSLRYYSEKNLPVSILCRLEKKYPGKKVFGVTEMTTDSQVEYYIKLEDEKTWITIHSNADGAMQVVEKYNKAS